MTPPLPGLLCSGGRISHNRSQHSRVTRLCRTLPVYVMGATTMVVLVTGGTGLVGCAIQDIIQQHKPVGEHWFFASSRDADLTSQESTEQLFDRIQPTHVIHLAAKVGGVYANTKDNVGFFRQNMAMQVTI